MKKYQLDLAVIHAERHESGYTDLTLKRLDGEAMPVIEPGQFVNILVRGAEETMLRCPISVNDVDYGEQTLRLLVKNAGPATAKLCASEPGDEYDILFPLGSGYVLPQTGARVLLVGGGVGTAPLLYLSRVLAARGIWPTILLGARTVGELVQLDLFGRYGEVCVATEDGSLGTRGFVTDHPAMGADYDSIMVCGPLPMMKAVARMAAAKGTDCQLSLENRMACGLGACLCCVEDTVEGHKCTCTDGPVFNLKQLKWEI